MPDSTKISIVFSLIGFFLSCVFAGCAYPQKTFDLSTDEAVIAELQKRADARNSISTGDERLDAKRRAAGKLEKKDVCIERLKESEEIIVIGFFRNDYGCRFEGAFVNSRFYEKTEIELHKTALDALGWQKANQTERERIAKILVEKVLLAFFTVFQTKPKDYLSDAFHAPKAVTTETDEVKVSGWYQKPPGMRSKASTQKFEYTFDKDGGILPNPIPKVESVN